MAFKHNLPIPALILILLAAAIAALILFHTPPDEDLIRQAVDKYVTTLGPIQQMEIHGNVADIIVGENGRLIYAEFEKKNGTWTYARNLAEEFSRAMKTPENQRDIYQHLGEKVSQRLQMSVTFKEGIPFEFKLGRDAEGTLIGQCDATFSYPKVGDQLRSGLYSEFFEWKDGRWQSLGPGSLFDKVGK